MPFLRQKWTEINDIKCQGGTEARACRLLFSLGLNPRRAKFVQTEEYGRYTPDFDCDGFYVEVKSPGTWAVALGHEPMMAKSHSHPEWTVKSNKGWNKIMWTAGYVQPILVMIIGHRAHNVVLPVSHGIDYFVATDTEVDCYTDMMEAIRGQS